MSDEKSDEKKMRALYEALADHVESLTDEQLQAIIAYIRSIRTE